MMPTQVDTIGRISWGYLDPKQKCFKLVLDLLWLQHRHDSPCIGKHICVLNTVDSELI